MATPPFQPDETAPAPSDLISAYPVTEQTFRDIIESWLLTISTENGVLKTSALPDNLLVQGQVVAGNSSGTMSDIPVFTQPLGFVAGLNSALVMETTEAAGVTGVFFSLGTTAYGQIRYLHASEDMQFYTNDTLRMTLDEGGIALASNLAISFAGTGAATTRTNLGLGTGSAASFASLTTSGNATVGGNLSVSGAATVTGNVSGARTLVGAGSAATPSMSFTGDSNTGFYNVANTSVICTINGTGRISFNANGITLLTSNCSFTGSGSGLTSLNASELGTGTMPVARFGTSATYSDWVRERYGGNTANEVGMPALLLGPANGHTAGGNYSSGDLRNPSLIVNTSNNSLSVVFGSAPSGTWKAMETASAGANERAFGIFVKVG